MSALTPYVSLRAPALFACLLQEAAEAASRIDTTPLQEGEPLIVALPHAGGIDDLVEIGGAFFHGKNKEDIMLNILIVLVGLLDADRPFCSPKRLALNIESPDRVLWTVKTGGKKGKKIEEGSGPLDQALSRMSCAGEEDPPGNLLPHIPDLKKKLPWGWELSFFRSCCLKLVRERFDYCHEIFVRLEKEWKILAHTWLVAPRWSKQGPSVAAYRSDPAAFVRRLVRRVDELLKLSKEDLPEALVTRWGEMKVAITRPQDLPTKYLPETRRFKGQR